MVRRPIAVNIIIISFLRKLGKNVCGGEMVSFCWFMFELWSVSCSTTHLLNVGLSSQAYCRNALGASDLCIYKGICSYDFTFITVVVKVGANVALVDV